MSTIALIPIDNRPVCYQLPLQIINQAKEHKLILPDISLMGNLSKNADVDGLLNWLETLKDIDLFVISLDTIAYGGLVSSRRSKDSLDIIKERINRFVKIIKKHSAKVFAFSSIMRISNNNFNEEEKEYWKDYGTKIFEYSYNLHKHEVQGFKESIETDIPQIILNDYLATRKRNFELNKYYIELKKQGLFDTLVFSKDDCAEYGLNVKEAVLLKEYAKDDKNIYVKTGADEIPLTLLSRAINQQKYIKIAPVYINPDFIDKISKYEDISVKESVESQIELAGGIVSQEENCDMILLVNNFRNQQGELVMNIEEPLFDGELNIPDKPYFIADILNANGSDNNFVAKLMENTNLKEFYGYAAWNTTGNTLGSAISAALTYFGAKIPNKHAFQNLQLTRFLDDWAYQANVRKILRDNPENLSETVLKVYMSNYENKIFKLFNVNKIKADYEYPWNRFFEIKVVLSKIYVKLPFVDILFYE